MTSGLRNDVQHNVTLSQGAVYENLSNKAPGMTVTLNSKPVCLISEPEDSKEFFEAP